jgi:hypothetical protein
MTIRDDIYNFLITLTDLMTLLGTNTIKSPDGEESGNNGITYRMISDPKQNDTNLRKSAGRKWQLWRFYINDQSKTKCQQIADELEKQLHEYSGDFGGIYANYIWLDSNASPFLLEDGSTYQVIQDFRITVY